MMRAFAVLSTGAIALIALPVTAGAASSESAAAPTGDQASGFAHFLTQPALLGLTAGATIWLSLALVALVVAVVAVRRSKSLAASIAPAAAEQLISDWTTEHHRLQGLPVQRTPLRVEALDHSGIALPATR